VSGEIVLVADDRADNLAFIREYVLKPHGYEMIAASNGEDALRTAQSQNVDLIISDLVMPKMGGLELLEHLRTAGNQLPAILMTFHGSEDTAVRAFRLGARDYIIKPFSIEEMLAAIDRALSEARLRKERDRLTRNLLNANQQLSHRVQELRILFGIGRSITALLDLEQVLNRIVEAAVYLSKAKESSLILVDEAGNLVQRSARKTGKPEAAVVPAIVSDSVAEAVIRRGEPLPVKHPQTTLLAWLWQFHSKSATRSPAF
jgi:two-component system, NtrC family, sensor kinase